MLAVNDQYILFLTNNNDIVVKTTKSSKMFGKISARGITNDIQFHPKYYNIF